MTTLSVAVLAEVEAVLTDVGARPKTIWQRLGRWSPVTARHALRMLVAQGRAAYDGADCQRRYRRAG
jgi:hypothetical protein